MGTNEVLNLCMMKYLFLNKQMTEHNSLLLFDILLSGFKCWFSFGSLFSVFKCFIFSFDPTISFHFPFQLFSTLKINRTCCNFQDILKGKKKQLHETAFNYMSIIKSLHDYSIVKDRSSSKLNTSFCIISQIYQTHSLIQLIQ